MNFRKHTTAAIIVMSVAGLGVGSAALADSNSHKQNDDPAEQTALFAAHIGLSEAISAAEVQTGARAISAELEQENGTYAYAIELVRPNGNEQEAYVDTASGMVTLVDPSEDGQNGDEDDDEDREDGEDRD